ncbi:MAG: 16S rRNA (cytosine(1402)-N(4))-methyltransferase RsmH [Oscillospiraceae bacterium]|jgi:16S rRNA (cytosine1402-N4)-methyltransferase|nr:16S rRNA (cytosine(1402)-N(4))-methyltransferase RsmH [Oscillospiraceae bacterium]
MQELSRIPTPEPQGEAAAHVPVLLSEAVDGLSLSPDACVYDGTLGAAGHTRAILALLGSAGRLFASDRDGDALKLARTIADPRLTLLHADFGDVLEHPETHLPHGTRFDAMLFDLGISSRQIDPRSGRGFSFQALNDLLDMRMDTRQPLTAQTILNEWEYEDLKRIFYTYGEERYAPHIAERIVEARAQEPLTTVGQLNALLKSHPKRVYQALRIAVNDELGSLERMLRSFPDRLNPGGRCAIIAFHSLEDRMVKHAFKDSPKLGVITKRPITPGEMELASNPRSRSAKLRVAERIQTDDKAIDL